MQFVNRLQSITLALLAAFGASTSAVAKVCVPENIASGFFAANYDQSAPVDDAGSFDFSRREAAHDYETVSGRPKWLSRDPIEEAGGANLYGMLQNRPHEWVDPLGLSGLDLSGLTHVKNAFLDRVVPIGQGLQEWWDHPAEQARRFGLGLDELGNRWGVILPALLDECFWKILAERYAKDWNRIKNDPNELSKLAANLAAEAAFSALGLKVAKVAKGGLSTNLDDSLIAAKGGASNAAAFQAYKDSLRAAMSKPAVTDPKLAGLLDDLYRPGASVGSGSTAAAVRHELATGAQVGGRTHTQKAQNYIDALADWLRNNPTARGGDRAAAENVMQDMINALNGK
jgi:hypothetical protein